MFWVGWLYSVVLRLWQYHTIAYQIYISLFCDINKTSCALTLCSLLLSPKVSKGVSNSTHLVIIHFKIETGWSDYLNCSLPNHPVASLPLYSSNLHNNLGFYLGCSSQTVTGWWHKLLFTLELILTHLATFHNLNSWVRTRPWHWPQPLRWPLPEEVLPKSGHRLKDRFHVKVGVYPKLTSRKRKSFAPPPLKQTKL